MAHDPVPGAVGPRLRALRRQRGATLAGLSELTGISVSTLSRLESGGRKPTLELLLPLALLYSGQGARLCRWIGRRVGESRFLTIALFGGAYVLIQFVLGLPIDYARHYWFIKESGLPGDAGPGPWLLRQLLGLLPLLVAAALLLWIPYALMRRSPRYWWLWATAAVAPVALFFLIVQPIWIKPLTTRYAPLADSQLRASIDAHFGAVSATKKA